MATITAKRSTLVSCSVMIQGEPLRFCNLKKKPWQLACSFHWGMLPDNLKKEVWRLYQEEPGSARHLASVQECLDFIEKLQADPEDAGEDHQEDETLYP
jgi:hypothetical protein